MAISSTLEFTSIPDIEKAHDELYAGFRTGKLKSIPFRKYQLLQLAYMIKDNVHRFEEAYTHDLGRHAFETNFTEVTTCLKDILEAYHNVEKWSKPERAPFDFQFFAMGPKIYKEAKGVVLIIGAFNYPFFVCLSPMIGAIAAGNAVLLKPAESTPAVSSLFSELFPKYLDSSVVKVVNGGVPETTRLLELQWDHICYTGNGRVGRIIAAAAGKMLTPVTLELGGKSPVFVDETCDVYTASHRILWGRFTNAGQTCIAPDYLLVPRSFKPKLIEAFKKVYEEFYAADKEKKSISRIVNNQAFKRLKGYLDETKGTVILGGETDEADRYIAPTVVDNIKPDDALMKDEIFGPILPIIEVENVDEALAFVNSHDHPLALYIFSQNGAYKEKVRSNTLSGSVVVNDVMIQTAVPGFPFGGVGPSGSGGYHHSKAGFDTFTHTRSYADNPSFTEAILKLRYPPYTDAKLKKLYKLQMPSLPARMKGPPKATATANGWSKWVILTLVAAIAGILAKRKSLSR